MDTDAPRPPRKRTAPPQRHKGPLKHLRHAILPVRANGHHPHILKREVMVGVLSLALVLEVAVLAQGLILFKNPNYLASVLPAVVASLTNDQRTENNLQPLAVSPLLTQAAQDKANDEAAKGYFSHVSPDGTLPWHWFDAVGYNYQYAGENLAVNFTDSTDVVNAWMASPTHRANILKQQYTEEGIGMATGMYEGQSTIFVVQFFAKPESGAGDSAVSDATSDAVPAASPVAKAVRDVKVALHTVPAPTELMTTTKPDSPIATSKDVSTDAPDVLGTETGPATPVSAATAPAPTFWQKLLASPFSMGIDVFAFIAAFILAVLIMGLIYRKRLPRMTATVGGLSVAVVVLGFAIVNQHYVSNNVKIDQVPQAAESAAAVRAF